MKNKHPLTETPVAYAEGCVEFLGRSFFVNPSVLIPRFDTEELVRIARTKAKELGIKTIIDIGTGSGIIVLSLACELQGNDITFCASDISPDALEVAQKNRENLGVACDFFTGNLFEPFLEKNLWLEGPFLVVANLPYIAINDPRVEADVREHEPHLALFWGDQGFELYAILFEQLRQFRQQNPLQKIYLAWEMGDEQKQDALLAFQGKAETPLFFADLSGKERFWFVSF